MPYISKKKLYDLEKRVFMNALIYYSGGLSHLKMDETANLLWQLYKKELSEEEFDEKMKELEKDSL